MIDARKLYEGDDEDCFAMWSSYTPIIKALGNVLVRVDEKNYQGDTHVLLEKDGKFGLLTFGWGSCAGCDALQGCKNYTELQSLIDRIERSVEWYLSLTDIKQRLHSEDMKVKYQWSTEIWHEFVEKVDLYIKEQ